jgi:hypothetical protein
LFLDSAWNDTEAKRKGNSAISQVSPFTNHLSFAIGLV